MAAKVEEFVLLDGHQPARLLDYCLVDIAVGTLRDLFQDFVLLAQNLPPWAILLLKRGCTLEYCHHYNLIIND